MSLFIRKPMNLLMEEASSEGSHTLKRTLGRTNLILLGIGAIIGAGIFVLTGNAAAQYAGPAVVWSFVVAGLACAFAGLCYAEFASMIPIAGSAYTYSYATLGELIAWIIGWDLILEYLFGAATVAVGWSGYVVSFLNDLGITLPGALTSAPGTKLTLITPEVASLSHGQLTSGWKETSGGLLDTLNSIKVSPETLDHASGLFNLPAMLIVGAVTYLLVKGIKESAKFNNIIVYVKVAVILAFILFGISYINTVNWEPFIPANPNEFGHFDKAHPENGGFGHFGITGILRAAGVIFFAYIGFDAVSTAAQEAKNPQKDMPWGILGSLLICTIIYIAVGFVLTGIVHYDKLNVSAPIAVAIDSASGLAWLKYPIKIGAIAGLSSVVLVMLMGQPRVFFSMSKDGLLPAAFSKVHPKFKTPYIPTILCGVIAAIVAGALPIGLLGEWVSIGTLLAFVLVCGGILVLRYKNPELKRPFKTPFFPVVPILGILSCVGVMAFLPADTWLRLLIWLAAGFIIYFGYSRFHSKLRNPEKQ
ncbi:MAG: amino acid permease [Chitinophagaceae bacterium]|nr:amino acid permease [Chitinophagaceae bacterium]